MWLWVWTLVCLSVSAPRLTGDLSRCTPPSPQHSWDWLQHQCRISCDTTSPVIDQLISSFQITICFLSSNLLLQISLSSNLCSICVTNFAPLQVLQDCHLIGPHLTRAHQLTSFTGHATLGSVSQLSILHRVHSPSFLTFLCPLLTKLLPVPCLAYMLTSASLDFCSAQYVFGLWTNCQAFLCLTEIGKKKWFLLTPSY